MHKYNLSTIIINKDAYYKYFIKETFKAGIVLQGWEVKSLRISKVNISNSYVILKSKEAFLFGANFTPLETVSTHDICYSTRTRKLLLNRRELNSLYGSIQRKGYTAVVLSLYWKGSLCKVEIGIAKGKKQYDKRCELKKREWQRNKELILKKINR